MSRAESVGLDPGRLIRRWLLRTRPELPTGADAPHGCSLAEVRGRGRQSPATPGCATATDTPGPRFRFSGPGRRRAVRLTRAQLAPMLTGPRIPSTERADQGLGLLAHAHHAHASLLYRITVLSYSRSIERAIDRMTVRYRTCSEGGSHARVTWSVAGRGASAPWWRPVVSLRVHALSRREYEIVRLAGSLASQRSDIARNLFLSEHTIETHLRNAYTKLDVHSKLELTRRAAQPASKTTPDSDSLSSGARSKVARGGEERTGPPSSEREVSWHGQSAPFPAIRAPDPAERISDVTRQADPAMHVYRRRPVAPWPTLLRPWTRSLQDFQATATPVGSGKIFGLP